MINNEYLAVLPKNKLLAANKICADYFERRLKDNPDDIVYALEILLEEEIPAINRKAKVGRSEVSRFVTRVLLSEPTTVKKKRTVRKRIRTIHRHIKAMLTKAIIAEPNLINTFLVELSEDEKNRIDHLLAEIRITIRDGNKLEKKHCKRLLKVTNNLQTEIDNHYSDFRVFLDGMGEASEAVGESGKKAKRVFNLMKELYGIANKVRKAKEVLEVPDPQSASPSLKRLPSPESFS